MRFIGCLLAVGACTGDPVVTSPAILEITPIDALARGVDPLSAVATADGGAWRVVFVRAPYGWNGMPHVFAKFDVAICATPARATGPF